jgi:hypothetical protein
MSSGNADSDPISTGDQPTEEELRATYEAEIKRIRVEHVLLEQVVSLVNLGMRRTGLAPGTESERDPGQVRLAIEAIRALAPLIEVAAPEQAGPIRDALSQLQLAFVRIGGAPGAGDVSEPPRPGAPGRPSAAGTGRPAEPSPAGPAPGPGPDPAAGEPPPKPGEPPPKPGEGGPAQRSGRLWIPGQ